MQGNGSKFHCFLIGYSLWGCRPKLCFFFRFFGRLFLSFFCCSLEPERLFPVSLRNVLRRCTLVDNPDVIRHDREYVVLHIDSKIVFCIVNDCYCCTRFPLLIYRSNDGSCQQVPTHGIGTHDLEWIVEPSGWIKPTTYMCR